MSEKVAADYALIMIWRMRRTKKMTKKIYKKDENDDDDVVRRSGRSGRITK